MADDTRDSLAVEPTLGNLSLEDVAQDSGNPGIRYLPYRGEDDIPTIMSLVDMELSEPYNYYTYRYFLVDWYVLLY